MIALMYDGLELGKFYEDEKGVLRLKLNDNIKTSWLPYIFEIGLDKDMSKVLKVWKKERVFPKNRIGSKRMLKALGLKKYDVDSIARATRCSAITDPYWLVYKETDTYTNSSVRGQSGDNYPYNSLNIPDEENYIWRI